MEAQPLDMIVFRRLTPGVLQFFVRSDGLSLEVTVSQRRALQIARDILDNCDLGRLE
jgi:hypothetical protein